MVCCGNFGDCCVIFCWGNCGFGLILLCVDFEAFCEDGDEDFLGLRMVIRLT